MDRSMDRGTPVLSIRGLTKHLGRRLILDNIDLDVYPGEIYGFLGPNGSGKTTTIKLMLGLLRIENGSISLCGKNIAVDFEGAIANIGGIIENPEMYRYLSGMENLRQYARMCDGVTQERIDEVVELVGLTPRINDKISKYSLGMRQRLGVAQAILHRPKLLVLDEPTNGLDPAGIKELREILKKLCREEGVSVFISSHLLAELEQMCDRVGIIDKGRMLGERTMSELQNTFGDGRMHLFVRTGDAEAARAAVEEMGYPYLAEPEGISISVENEEIPSIVRGLVAAEVDIYEISVRRKSLESAFLEIVGEAGPVGMGGFETAAPEPRVFAAAESQANVAPETESLNGREEDRL